MRQHFTPYTAADKALWREMKRLTATGMTLAQAGDQYGLPYARVRQVMNRSYPTPLEMRERRKGYIVRAMTDPKRKLRISPYLISKFFMIDESFVEQMIQELRREGKLPPGNSDDQVERAQIVRTLQRHFPNVYRSATVGKTKEVGDMLMVAGKGWLTWTQAAELAEMYKK